MDNTEEVQKYLDEHLNKITNDRYFVECYPECKNTPAWFIKTEPTDLLERKKAIQYYVSSLLRVFENCPEPTKQTIAMYIPSHDKEVFSNCGKVVLEIANNISWLVDGTSAIKRSKTICAKHKSFKYSLDENLQQESLEILTDIKSKNIMLFDDRITRGNTANQVTDLLYFLGANHVWFIAFDLTDRQAIITRTPDSNYIVKIVINCKLFEFKLHRSETRDGFSYWYGTSGGNSVRIMSKKNVFATLNGREYRIIQIDKQQKKKDTFVGKIIDNEQVML